MTIQLRKFHYVVLIFKKHFDLCQKSDFEKKHKWYVISIKYEHVRQVRMDQTCSKLYIRYPSVSHSPYNLSSSRRIYKRVVVSYKIHLNNIFEDKKKIKISKRNLIHQYKNYVQ